MQSILPPTCRACGAAVVVGRMGHIRCPHCDFPHGVTCGTCQSPQYQHHDGIGPATKRDEPHGGPR